jgi:membrane-associated phospholipid phosphatase
MDGMHLRYGRPLLAAPARLRAGALLACCAVLVAALGTLFAHQATADRLDQAIDSPIIACLLTGRLNGAVLAAAAVPAAVGLNDGLCKPLVHRTYLGVLSYPSGHTATMFALAATVAVLLFTPPRPAKAGALRVLIPAAACVLGCVVAVGVIALRWHYFTDTVAGAAVGIGTVCGLALLLDLPAVRQRLARGSSQAPAAQERRSAAAQASGRSHSGRSALIAVGRARPERLDLRCRRST